MLSLGVHPHFLSSCLLGVVAQRLVADALPAVQGRASTWRSPRTTFDEVRPCSAPDEGQVLYGRRGLRRNAT